MVSQGKEEWALSLKKKFFTLLEENEYVRLRSSVREAKLNLFESNWQEALAVGRILLVHVRLRKLNEDQATKPKTLKSLLQDGSIAGDLKGAFKINFSSLFIAAGFFKDESIEDSDKNPGPKMKTIQMAVRLQRSPAAFRTAAINLIVEKMLSLSVVYNLSRFEVF